MAYCPKCGALLLDGANFCQSCGAKVSALTQAAAAVGTDLIYAGDGYAVMLVDNGSCTPLAGANLLSDTCGYTDAEALALISNAPTLVAQSLTRQQAVYLAQCMTEYGLEVAVYDKSGNLTLTSDVDSVFDNGGSFLAGVASALGLIGVSNRIAQNNIRRWTLRTRPVVYTAPKPPRRPTVRRYTFRTAPAPRPRVFKPAPAARPVPRAAVGPAPNPKAAHPRAAGSAHMPGTIRPAGPARPATPGRAPSARPAGPVRITGRPGPKPGPKGRP